MHHDLHMKTIFIRELHLETGAGFVILRALEQNGW